MKLNTSGRTIKCSWVSRCRSTGIFQRRRGALLRIVLLAAVCAAGSPFSRAQQKPHSDSRAEAIPIAEFSRMVREFSEEGGYFQADNFTSNETSYLHVVDKFKE